MKKNEIACFLINHDYAYGEMGCPPRVPPKSMVFFEVELMHFHDEEKVICAWEVPCGVSWSNVVSYFLLVFSAIIRDSTKIWITPQIAEFDCLPPEEMAKYSRVYPAAEERWKEGKAQYSAGRLKAALTTFRIAAT